MPSDLKVAVIIFASVPMFSIYPIIGGEYGEQSFCASTLLITTVLSFFHIECIAALFSVKVCFINSYVDLLGEIIMSTHHSIERPEFELTWHA